MLRKKLINKLIVLLVFSTFVNPTPLFAQGGVSDSTGGTVNDPALNQTPTQSTGSAPVSEPPQSAPTEVKPAVPTITTPRPSEQNTEIGTIPKETPKETAPVTEPPQNIVIGTANIETKIEGTNNNTLLALCIIGLAVLGFFGLKIRKNKNENENKDCPSIQKLMEEKLKEFTDLEGQLKSMAEDKLKDELKDQITNAELKELVNKTEKAKKAYGKYKELYEKCVTTPNSEKNKVGYIPNLTLEEKEFALRELKSRKVFAIDLDDKELELRVQKDGKKICDIKKLKKILGQSKKPAIILGDVDNNNEIEKITNQIFKKNSEGQMEKFLDEILKKIT